MLPDDGGPSEGIARYMRDLTHYADRENRTARLTQYVLGDTANWKPLRSAAVPRPCSPPQVKPASQFLAPSSRACRTREIRKMRDL